MAVAATVHGGYLPSKFRRFTPSTVSQMRPTPPPPPPPIFISTNPNDVNPIHLRDLYSFCNHSCHRFPKLNSEGRVEPVDIDKLRKALLHSYVVVSVFTRPEFVPDLAPGRVSGSGVAGIGGDWIGKVVPVTPGNGVLVGFGRAVSDSGLTAAIYDVMVIPLLRRRGIGRKIVQRILRILVNRDIYDIAALCSDQQKPFFRACGFGDDVLASTTMMYTRNANPVWKHQVNLENYVVAKKIEDMRRFQSGGNNLCKPRWFILSSEFERKWWNAVHTQTGDDVGFEFADHSSLANKYELASV